MKSHSGNDEGDRGATLVLSAMFMVALLIMAALVVDVGAAFNERRQDQSAADAAALGGAAFAGAYAKSSNPLQFAVDEAKRLAEIDVGRPITQGQWDACTDSGVLSVQSNLTALALTGGTPCISFDSGFTKLRVRVPNQTTTTGFARIMGINSLTTSAFAEASLILQGAGQFPSSVYSGVGAGARVCLSGGEKPVGACPGGSGTFGSFAPRYYTAIPLNGNTTTYCDAGNANDALARTMANGLDHALGYWSSYDVLNPPTSGARVNGALCPQAALPALPNTVVKGTGNEQAALFKGLIEGATLPNEYGPYVARFQRGNFKNGVTATIQNWSVNGIQMDNRPLWTFLLSGTGISACEQARAYGYQLSGTTQAAAAVTELTKCLADWSALPVGNPNKKDIFTEQVQESPRLASVPRFAETGDCGNSSCQYHIVGFSPVFMTTVFAEISGNKPGCTHMVGAQSSNKSFCLHTTGLTDTWTQTTKLEGLEAVTIPCGALPEPICIALDPTRPGQDFGTTFVVRLVK